jgi:hypothetical protein
MHPHPSRPIGITLLSLLFLWIGCIGTLFFPIMILAGGTGQLSNLLESGMIHSHVLSVTLTCVFAILWFGCYVLYAWIGFGLWKLRLAALKGTIVVHWFGIAMGLAASIVLLRYAPVLALGIGVWTVGIFGGILWYLMRPRVRWPFEVTFAASRGLPIPPLPSTSGLASWKTIAIGVSVATIIVATFTISLLYTVQKVLRSSAAYEIALKQAQSSPCAAAKLGTPFIAKGLISGTLEGGSNGSADLEIPVRGPNAEGSLHVVAVEREGTWSITDLTLEHSEGQIHVFPVPSSCQ